MSLLSRIMGRDLDNECLFHKRRIAELERKLAFCEQTGRGFAESYQAELKRRKDAESELAHNKAEVNRLNAEIDEWRRKHDIASDNAHKASVRLWRIVDIANGEEDE